MFGKDKLVNAPNCCYVSVGSQLSNSLKRIKLCRTSVKLFIFLLLQKIDAPSWILTFFLKTTIPYSLSFFASDINVFLLLRFLKLAVSGTYTKMMDIAIFFPFLFLQKYFLKISHRFLLEEMLSLSSLLPEIEVETFAKAIFNVAEERREDIGAVLRGLLTFTLHYLH